MSLLYTSTCFEHNCAHHYEVKIVSHSIWHHHTLQASVRCTGWEKTAQLCSKHVEVYNKLIIKQKLVH